MRGDLSGGGAVRALWLSSTAKIRIISPIQLLSRGETAGLELRRAYLSARGETGEPYGRPFLAEAG